MANRALVEEATTSERPATEARKSDLLSFFFWANWAVFAVHVMDETVMTGGLVAFIQRHFWSGFQMESFAIANGIWRVLIALSNLLYDWLGNRIAVVPLAFLWERCFNAVFHVGTTFYFWEYCPGLVTGVLFFVILYLVCRFAMLSGKVRWSTVLVSAIPAAVFETIFVSSMWWAH